MFHKWYTFNPHSLRGEARTYNCHGFLPGKRLFSSFLADIPAAYKSGSECDQSFEKKKG
jgi:hypothetical protein